MVFDSIPVRFDMGIFSAQEMGEYNVSITFIGLRVDLFDVGKHRHGIPNLNHGISGRWDLVCVRG